MYKVDGFKIGTAAASLEASYEFYFGKRKPRKPMKRLWYDPECETLAKHFLQDTKVDDEAHMRRLVEELSQAIQEVVEQWFLTLGLEKS